MIIRGNMRFEDFKRKFSGFPVVSYAQMSVLGEKDQALKNQLSRWVRKGLISRLRKGIYVLNGDDRKISLSRQFIANQLYFPSYVSNEYALSFYGLIPERVADVTSVTPRKTAEFSNEFGTFVYQHVKKDCFNGYTQIREGSGLNFLIAVPEKAVVDFIYFNIRNFKRGDPSVFTESYRFQNLSSLRKDKITGFAKEFRNNKLSDIAKTFRAHAGKGR